MRPNHDLLPPALTLGDIMATQYTYEIEFVDEVSGAYMNIDRTYDQEMEWEDIWDDVVKSGDIQMVHNLVSVEEEDEDEDN
jgi:hypothetical protein